MSAPRVSFVSLGCPKALVDSERIITRLRAEGYELTRKHEGADLVLVNTCGFLDSAQAESLAAIGNALNENGKVLPYLDVPFQHAAPVVLRRMKRPAAQEKTLERIARWRGICPEL